MLDHVSITVYDFTAAERFYDAIMKALDVVKASAKLVGKVATISAIRSRIRQQAAGSL